MAIQRTCRITGQPFTVSDCELDQLARLGAANSFVGSDLPIPTVTPTEALRRIAVYGNLLHLFWSKSALSGKPTLSRFNPQHSLKVVTPEEFWSDQVDNSVFGRDYDFQRPFFEQFNELLRSTYNLPLGNVNVENSDFINGAVDVKDSYLSFVIIGSTNCLYCFNMLKCSDMIDCCFCDGSSYCYCSTDLSNCYQCQHCTDSENCQDCFGCWDCRSCSNCLGCFGLERQQFCIFNHQLSEQEYRIRLTAANLGSATSRFQMLAQIGDFFRASSHKPNRIINCEESSGAYLRNCGSMEFCFNSRDSRDCGYSTAAHSSRDCWRGYFTRSELCYTGTYVDSYNCHFSYHPFNAESLWYSFGMYNGCRECFGCVGLKKATHQILNRQYSANEYYQILPRIVSHMKSTGEWGEWFPVDQAPYSYDEGWTTEYFEPISDAEIIRRGYYRNEYSAESAARDVVDRALLADNILDFDIVGLGAKAIRCERTGLPFSIQRKEWEFYRTHTIPIPSLHWRERILDLLRPRVRIPDSQGEIT